jgi:hypothetical protein
LGTEGLELVLPLVDEGGKKFADIRTIPIEYINLIPFTFVFSTNIRVVRPYIEIYSRVVSLSVIDTHPLTAPSFSHTTDTNNLPAGQT